MDDISEDILHRIGVHSEYPHLEIKEQIHNQALVFIEDMSYLMCGSLIVRLGMPSLNRRIDDTFERELQLEREYDTNALSHFVRSNVSLLNPQQKKCTIR